MNVVLSFLALLLLGVNYVSAWLSSPSSKHALSLVASPRTIVTRSMSESKSELMEPKRNPDRPELPELKGDFDWDEKFRGDEDWITENVPGKIVLNELQLASQISALDKLEEKWRKQRDIKGYEDEKKVGFVEKAETLNGRTAMFFLVTGLLTEYWTGFSMPEQVEEMLRVSGFLGFE